MELASCHVELTAIPTGSLHFGEAFPIGMLITEVTGLFQYFLGEYSFHSSSVTIANTLSDGTIE